MGKRVTTTTKPEPVPVNVVCSLCGEAWASHREENGEVSTLECIRLLKAKVPTPVVVWRDRWYPTYPQPTYPTYPTYPTWIGGTGTISPNTTTHYTINSANEQTTATTPRVLTASAA